MGRQHSVGDLLAQTPKGEPDPVRFWIQCRRRQILVNSIIYYSFGSSLVSDATFDAWCADLVELQRQFPEVARQTPLAEAFAQFDGSTGYDLPLNDSHYRQLAAMLLGCRELSRS